MLRREVLGNTRVMVQMRLELEIENLLSYWSTVSYVICYGLDNVLDLLNMLLILLSCASHDTGLIKI